jgi:tRNA-specific 2-thiouridylase
MRVLVAMSGGVDSSVAAGLLQMAGHHVCGVTMKLWGGASDRGCCSVSDVDDARRVADRLGIDHHVFNFSDDFEARVVGPYVDAHAQGCTPNPCIECNRHLKFDRLVDRAVALGFDAVATGHHARVVSRPGGGWRVARAADSAKDQSYVLYMLGQEVLARVVLPVGAMTKDEVRRRAAAMGLRTAAKPDSQEVCFIQSTGGRAAFLADRLQLRPGTVRDTGGATVGEVAAVQLVTIGQRKGLGLAGGDQPRYVVEVDSAAGVVTVGSREDLRSAAVELTDLVWADRPVSGLVLAQCSAHGAPLAGRLVGDTLHWDQPQRKVAPGQSVVLYEGDEVLGGGLAR